MQDYILLRVQFRRVAFYSGFGLDRFLFYSGFCFTQCSVQTIFCFTQSSVQTGFCFTQGSYRQVRQVSVLLRVHIDRFLFYSGFHLDKFDCIHISIFQTDIDNIDSMPSFQYFEVPSWLRSYGSWIYNYLCNQCLSPLKL